MSDTTSDNDDLSLTHEYIIAGVVILLFGLLYWFLNNGWNGWNSNPQKSIEAAPPLLGAVSHRRAETVPAVKKGYPVSPAVAATTTASAGAVAMTTTTAKQHELPDSSLSVTSKIDTPEKNAPEAELIEKTSEEKQADETVDTADTANEANAPATEQLTQADSPVIADEVANNKNQSESPAVSDSKPKEDVMPTYTLPDGTVVQILADGFEGELQQLFQNGVLNKPLIYDQIYFDTGSAKINAKSDRQIKVTAALMNAYPKTNILLRGHTDNRGSPTANFQLSLKRANSMGLALGALGIDTERIRVLGMGDGFPIASNNTEEGRKKNRRIEILLQ